MNISVDLPLSLVLPAGDFPESSLRPKRERERERSPNPYCVACVGFLIFNYL